MLAGIRPQHKNGHTALFSLNDGLLSFPIITSERQQRVGFFQGFHNFCGHIQLFRSLQQAITCNAIRIDGSRLEWLAFFLKHLNRSLQRFCLPFALRLALAVGRAIEGGSISLPAARNRLGCRAKFLRYWFLGVDFIIVVTITDLWRQGVAAQERIHSSRNIPLDCNPVAILDLHQHIKCGWCSAFKHCFLCAAPARLIVRKCH